MHIAGGLWWFSSQSCRVMSREGLPADLGQGDVFLLFSSCGIGGEGSFSFMMFLHALLADGLSQGWLKTSLGEGSTMLRDLLNVLVLALAGSSLPRM